MSSMISAGDFHDQDGDGVYSYVASVHLAIDPGDTTSVAARLAAALREAVEAWRADPNGPIQFNRALIGRTYVAPLPREKVDDPVQLETLVNPHA